MVVALAAGLFALPALAGALPAHSNGEDAASLVAKVRRSGSVAWSGYGESRGSVVLPDVSQLGSLPALVGGTQRTRAWWRTAQDWRVDALSLVGETDTTHDQFGMWTWVSADRRATRVNGDLPVRLPVADDLLAPVLGRRLAGSADVTATRIGARRVAGRSTAGVRLVATRAASTTVQSVELWVEPSSGLVLETVLRAGGSVVLDALLLDLELTRPAPGVTRFVLPADAQYVSADAPDLASQADRFAPFVLPASLAGVRRSDQVGAFHGVTGVATYGEGLGSFAVVPLPRRTARDVIAKLVRTGTVADRATVSTPLVNGLVGRSSGREDGRGYLIVGTVPAHVLGAALVQLLADPPPRVDRS